MKYTLNIRLATSTFAKVKTQTIVVPMRDGVKLGIEHTRLTRRRLGRDYRFTDVDRSVVKETLA